MEDNDIFKVAIIVQELNNLSGTNYAIVELRDGAAGIQINHKAHADKFDDRARLFDISFERFLVPPRTYVFLFDDFEFDLQQIELAQNEVLKALLKTQRDNWEAEHYAVKAEPIKPKKKTRL